MLIFKVLLLLPITTLPPYSSKSGVYQELRDLRHCSSLHITLIRAPVPSYARE
jgi:hypothetical protein